MKIVGIIPSLNAIGGAEKFFVDLFNGLAEEDTNDVKIILLYDIVETAYLPSQISEKIEVISFSKKEGLSVNLMFKLYYWIRQNSPDVVHTHLGALKYSMLASLLISRVRYFHTIHCLPKYENTPFLRFLLIFFYKFGIITPITISKEVDQQFIEIYHSKRSILIENGINKIKKSQNFSDAINSITELKKVFKDHLIILNIANVHKIKNQDLIGKVARMAKEDGQKFLFINIGRIDDSKYFEYLNESKPENFIFLGPKLNATDYLFLADAFILTSNQEGAPISVLEAISIGVIPICTPVGGLKSMINNHIGFLSSNISESAFYCSLQDFLHYENKDILRENCVIHFEKNFTLSACIEKYRKLFAK